MNVVLLACVLVLAFQCISAFQISRVVHRTGLKSLTMGGGRSPAERTMSKKQMFRALRTKINEAAKLPGFFEVGEGPPEIDLYCKSNKDGRQISDCPYTMFIQLVLLKKGIRYQVRPTLPSARPDWLINKHNGDMPALVHKDKTLTNPLAIAEYIEKTFPHNSLTRQGVYSYQEVLEKTAQFFPTLTAYLKNTDPARDEELGAAVEAQLDIIDGILKSTPGYYTCGIELTLADLYLAPQLFHAAVAMDHFKQREVLHLEGEPTRRALETFMTRMFDSEEFNHKKVYVSADQVVYGWKLARGEQ